MTRLVLSPFARLDGDLRVELDIEAGAVERARVAETFYRGFERMLRGRGPRDGMVLTPRVCGQCSLAHAAAAARALRSISQVEVPPNGHLALCVMTAVETIATHLTNLYFHLAPALAAAPASAGGLARFAALTGSSFIGAVAGRRALLPILGLFAGKWPNSLAVQPGGSTRPVDRSEISRSLGVLSTFRSFVEEQLLGGRIAEWLELRSDADLGAWLQRRGEHDLGLFVAACLDQGLDRLGRGPGAFLSSGGWETGPGEFWLGAGFVGSGHEPFRPERITEQAKHSWRDAGPSTSQPPPPPQAEASAEAYSWGKAPRYAGQPAETGSLARLVCARDPLVLDVVDRRGPSAYARALARLHELVLLTARLETWLLALDPKRPFCAEAELPASGQGLGLIEAPRGTLGHWVTLDGGRIADYQIITPTAWNFSPRDDADVPGPVEAALAGLTVADPAGEDPALLWVVRSFDPCLYCSVH